MAVQSFDYKQNGLMLFRTRFVCTKINIYVVISWLYELTVYVFISWLYELTVYVFTSWLYELSTFLLVGYMN